MKYLIGYFQESVPLARSEEIACDQGCHGEITLYWFGVFQKYDAEEWGMAIPEDQEDKITQEEIDSLKTWEYLDDNDWWSPPPLPPGS